MHGMMILVLLLNLAVTCCSFYEPVCPIHGDTCRSNPPWDGVSCGDPRGLNR